MIDSEIISGAVAGVAVIGSVVTTGLTLRHQRKADNQRRRHERHMRLLESGLKTAVDFLAAADQLTRAAQALDTANISLDGAKSSGGATYERFREAVEQARSATAVARDAAEVAYAALRVLMPSGAYPARKYLDFCATATSHPDETKPDRERAREMVEDAIRRAFGSDLADDWVFAEPVPGPRWWQVRRHRRDTRQGGRSKPGIGSA